MNQPQITRAKYRPKHERLEVTISTNNSNNNDNDSSNDNNNNNNTELIMRSSKISKKQNLAIMVLNKDDKDININKGNDNGISFHLTPLDSILQLRPSFDHVKNRKDFVSNSKSKQLVLGFIDADVND